MKHNISRYLLTLVALLTMTTGAWAQEEYESFDLSSANTNVNGTHFTITGTSGMNNYGLFLSGGSVTVTSLNGENITRVEFIIGLGKSKAENITGTSGTNSCTNGNENGSITDINATSVTLSTENTGNTSVSIKQITVYYGNSEPAAPEVTISDDQTSAEFEMPDGDVTVNYVLKRNMGVQMPVTVGDGTAGYSLRLKKEGESYVPAEMTVAEMMAKIKVHDGIENEDLVFSGDGKNCNVSIYAVNDEDQPTGDAIAFASLTPGRYVAIATPAEGSIYKGQTQQSNIFVLFEKFPGTISYDVKKLEKALGDSSFINPLTIVGDGIVTYTLSGDKMAEINAETGEVKLVDAPGIFTVTATVEDGENYFYETRTASYIVNVALPIETPYITDYDDPAILANKLALLTALEKAKELDLTIYKPAGAQKLAEAMAVAEALLKAEGGAIDEIDAARRAIQMAIDELEARAAKAEVAEKEVPEGWENMITNGNFATDDVCSFFMVEPGKGCVPATVEDGVDQGDWHAAVVRSQDSPSQDWDTQFFIRANTPLPVGTKIHVEFDYRSDIEGGADTQSHKEPTQYIHWACIGSPTFKSEWQHWSQDVTVDNNMSDDFQTIAFNLAKNKKATTFYFDNIVFWAQKPAPAPEDEFQDIIVNGNMEGADVVNFISKTYPSTAMVPSTIVAGAGKDGSKGIVIESPAKVSEEWDSQFWIVLPYSVPAGTTIKLQFDYKASAAPSVSTQAHEAPGNYIHWACCGNVDFTTEWKTFEKQFSVPAECNGELNDQGTYYKNFKSIAFNLAKADAITYYIDNVKLFLNKDVIATGVESVQPAVISNEAIFDLQGRRVAQPGKGLYIKNGKKIYVR